MHCIACAADCWLPAVNQLLKVNPPSFEFHLNIFSELVIDMHCTWSSFEHIQHSYHWPRIRSLSMPTTLSLRRNADDDDDEHPFIHIEIAIGLYIFFFSCSLSNGLACIGSSESKLIINASKQWWNGNQNVSEPQHNYCSHWWFSFDVRACSSV